MFQSIWAAVTKNTIGWVAYKQQVFISYSSGGWEVQDRGAHTDRLSYLVTAHFLVYRWTVFSP